jgi:P-type conjugative transfer protein TrbJ
MKRHWLRGTFAAGATIAMVLLTAPASADLPVIDVSVLSQNVIEAARLLQQINNQLQSLQNQAMMLENMARNLASLNLSTLNQLVSPLQQISQLINQAQGIAFTVNATESAFAQFYPQQYGSSTSITQLLADARSRWQNSMSAFQQTLAIQSQIAQNVSADTGTLSSLVAASQGATGNLQALQANNQLLALSTKQQLQIQTLMATQYRAEALEQARDAEAEEEAQTALANFLGSDTAYTAQP